MDFPNDNKKAIAPLRVSSYGQRDNTSHATQERDIRAYCKQNKIELVDLIPIVESAKKSELRKKYSEVIRRALKEDIRHIIFHKYDREARNLTDNENNENLVREGKVILHYVADQKVLHKLSPDSDFLMRDFYAVQNKHYSRDLSTKVRAATKTKAEYGWYPGTHPPLGYVHEKLKDQSGRAFRRGSVIVRNPEDRLVRLVRREFELRAQSLSLREIRKQIIEEGYIRPGELQNYHVGSIDRRLRNIFYDCRFIWQGVEYPGKQERLVPSEIFWKVQETFGMRVQHSHNDEALFGNGWIKCAACGCNIVYDPVKKSIKATGEVKIFKYYHCTDGKGIHGSLKGLRVSEDGIMDQFASAVGQISIREDFRDELMHALTKAQKGTRVAIERDMESYEAALIALRNKEDRAYDHYDSGMIDKDTYNHQRKRLQDERASYTHLMKKAQLSINDVSNETVKSILQLATNADLLWKRQSHQQRRIFLDKLLSNPLLEAPTVRYEIIKPLRTLSSMKGDEKWRRR